MDNHADGIRIFSMISGKTQEESEKIIEKNREFADKITDMIKYLGKTSKDNLDLINRVSVVISALIQVFPKEVRQFILDQVVAGSLSGKSDNLMDQIKKFSP